jgi:glutaredoxin
MVLGDLSVRKGYPVICYELGTEFTREEFYAEFGEGSTFPQVVFDKKNIGGCSDTVKYLQENNMF